MAIPSGSHRSGSGADPSPDTNLSLETERTVSEARSCASCGTSLNGRRRQALFCSARCRTQYGRTLRADKLVALFAALEEAVNALKLELEVPR
jgi:endogenous inhibitor of DNA gyrase (YacG/DUF329 family)